MGLGILFLSLAMLKGVFPRFVAYIGIAPVSPPSSAYPLSDRGTRLLLLVGLLRRLAPRRRMEAVQAGTNGRACRLHPTPGCRTAGVDPWRCRSKRTDRSGCSC